MKKAFYWIAAMLQLILLIAAYGIQKLSMKKMGMMRYVVYINQQWEAKYPIAAIRNTTIAFLVILFVVILLYVFIKKGNYITDKKAVSMLLVNGIILSGFIFFTLSYSVQSYRSYYFTSLILAGIALIQEIKIIVSLIRYDYSRRLML